MNTFLRARSTLSAALLTTAVTVGAAALPAQSLDGQVVRNPDNTVTYTIDLDGPPRGQAQLFLGFLLGPPIQLIPFGPWLLDPTLVLVATPFLPLDNNGAQQFQLTVPADLTAGVPLVFQSVNLDLGGNLRLSNNAMALGHNHVPPPPQAPQQKPFNYTFAYDANGGGGLRLAGTGNPGSVVEVRIVDSNGVRVTRQVTIGVDCKFFLNVAVPGGITENDDVLITLDGALVDKIDLYKF